MTAKFSCKIGTTDPAVPLGMTIKFNDLVIFDIDVVDNTIDFNYEFNDDDGNHSLSFTMKNKRSEHTVINDLGEIVKDARLTITDVNFEGIPLGQILIENAVYQHDFNGTQPLTHTKFFGELGCNGTVVLQFNTPIYLWLLEQM